MNLCWFILILCLIVVVSSKEDETCHEECKCDTQLGNDKCDTECDSCACNYDHGDCYHFSWKDGMIIGLSIGGTICLILGIVIVIKFYKIFSKRNSRTIMQSIRNTNHSAIMDNLNTSNSSFIDTAMNEELVEKNISKQYLPCEVSLKENSICTICFDDFDDNQFIRKTACRHIFHVACFDAWINHSKQLRCPNCNKEFKLYAKGHKIPRVREIENISVI